MLSKTVADYLRANRGRHVASLTELLCIPSIANVTGEKADSCRTAAEWLARHLSGLGLDAEVVPAGGKPNVLAEGRAGDGLPTLLIYGHYDVQPPDPLELWTSKPFEPTERDGFLYARGASDNKGQLLAYLTAMEAWVRAGGGLPVNVKVIVEGEEEIGSPNLEPFIRQHADRLRSDAIIISDAGFFADGVPSITYSLRGLAYFEITLTGPAADLHSGQHGGAVANPINALTRLIAGMHDSDGRVTLPGFYDDVLPLTDQERSAWAELPFDESAYARELGADELAGGEKGYSVLERRWARPTLDANGIVGGYIQPGAKTVIPAKAGAKVSCRLVPNQDPAKIAAGMRQYLDAHKPAGTKAELAVHATARPVMVRQDAPAMKAAKGALAEAFGAEPAMVRCGASVPITELFQRLLGRDGVLMGFGLPGDNIHSPNERFKLEQFYRGTLAAAALLQNVRDDGL